ncbi:hypothetical protein BC830DRAFT_349904 [Chytriomyces sp. MP71]|nr:hypothetical protein BC830DRAFT_349904 [Chytriomyces sp. MP71]
MDILSPRTTGDIQCDAWVETPVFFISRWDTTNPYQFHQDALNTFLVYSLLNLNPDEIQPVLLDARARDGPFTLAWSHIFSSSHHLVDIRQLANSSSHAGQMLCFRRAVWGVHGGISALSMDGKNSISERNGSHISVLMNAFREFMMDRIRRSVFGERGWDQRWLPLRVPESYAVPIERLVWSRLDAIKKGVDKSALEREVVARTGRVIVITYAVRGTGTKLVPESVLLEAQIQGVLESDSQPEPMKHKATKESRLSRTIKNDLQVMFSIQRASRRWSEWGVLWNADLRGMEVQFRAVDFGSLSFVDQVAISSSTDFFIGTHGAHFAHLLYLRRNPVAGVLELQPPERSKGNHQFENLSLRMGHVYGRVRYGRKDVNRLGEVVGGAQHFVSAEEVTEMERIVYNILNSIATRRMCEESK